MALKVNEQSDEVESMAAGWAVVSTLLGGTAAMRAAATEYLFQWPAESGDSYAKRLRASTLFPALQRTISVMRGKPFAKQLTIGDDVPEVIQELCEDVDQQGNSLHSFASDIFGECLGYGICGVLVDYPEVNREEVTTLEQERSLGLRPYLVFIKHNQILGWQHQRVNGVTMLTQLRILETVEVPDGPFGTACIEQVRVLTPTGYELWQENKEKEWVLVKGVPTSIGVIPFVPFYGDKRGFMCGASPLLELAHLNVKHWQSQSDQDNLLHVARVPVLVIIGGDEQTSFTVGGSSAGKLPPGADMKFVEHSGKAIESGEKAIESLEEHMIQTGAELMVKRPGQQRTATQDSNEAEANKSDLQRMVESFEDSLDQVLQLIAMWLKEPEGGHVSMFKDFGASTLGEASAQLVIAMQQAGLITKRTAIEEQQRRGMLSPDIDADDELAEVDGEGPALGTMGDMGAPGQSSGVDVATATGQLDDAITLHEKHMNGTAPTTGAAGEKSQQLMMDQMMAARAALGNDPGNVSMADPAAPGNVSTPTTPAPAPAADIQPLVDSISALVAVLAKPETPEAPEPPLDLSPIIEAIRAMQPPVINMPDVIVNSPITVNVPEQPAASIVVNTPEVTVPVTVAPAQASKPSNVKFDTNEAGDITGASLS